jgi:acyl-CoA synthetase (AMP-forming)/AMP-acid ligase II
MMPLFLREQRMTLGAMQDWPLRVMRLVDYAEREHGEGEIVSAWADGSTTRTNWRQVAHEARQMAQALERLGIKPGDRVATLAMNHSRHLTAWYGACGMGGVLHTINPRLFPDQLEYIGNHAEDRVLLYDRAFTPLVEKMKPRWKTIEHYVCFDPAEGETDSRSGSRARTAIIAGSRATSASPAASATPPGPPETRRACSTSIARPCFTRWPR